MFFISNEGFSHWLFEALHGWTSITAYQYQTDPNELALMKADLSPLVSKLHLNTLRELQLTVS